MRIDIAPWHLRPLKAEDVDALVKYANNADISSTMGDTFPFPYTLIDGMSWLGTAIGRDPTCQFAVASDDEMIGCVGIHPMEDVYHLSCEIGYWVAEPFWGRGVATSALIAATEYAFSQLHMIRVQARVFSNNPASARVLEKAGFQFEGTMRKSVLKRGEVLDQFLYAKIDV
jgi:RimJ/RimL family protein N-acetyltransferase